MSEPKEEYKRTTVRLPLSLHASLKEAAAREGMTAEKLIEIAVKQELHSRSLGKLEIPTEWGSLLAQRFAECVPTPIVIKDTTTRIVWCNVAYENLFNRSRGYLLNKKITELGLLEDESAERIKRDLNALRDAVDAEDALDFWEPLTLPVRGTLTSLLFRAQRFVFRPRNDLRLLGDISFDWAQIIPGTPRRLAPDLHDRLKEAALTPEMTDIFPSFLGNCPVAIAIKKPDGKIIWCNTQYERLARQKLANLIGKTSKQIFVLKDSHPLIQNEYTVANTLVWMYSVEELPHHKPRTSLRFPVLKASGDLAFYGVISVNFRQEEKHLQAGDAIASGRTCKRHG
jgi:PAS domain-containing protein